MNKSEYQYLTKTGSTHKVAFFSKNINSIFEYDKKMTKFSSGKFLEEMIEGLLEGVN